MTHSNTPRPGNGVRPGEGDREADRAYREATERFVREGRVDAAAREAKRAVDSPEGGELRAAEAAGRERSAGEGPARSDGGAFKLDMERIRRDARREMNRGPVTPAYGVDAEQVVAILNTALATELVCVLRYKQNAAMTQGFLGEIVKAEFLEHAAHEQLHADKLMERIVQIGGEPEMNPAVVAERSHAQYSRGEGLGGMVRENLVAERIAIQTYAEIIQWLGDRDSTTRRILEEILAQEEEHADDLRNLLTRVEA